MTVIRENHIGVVSDVDDPEKNFRIKVRCGSLFGIDNDTGDANEGPWWVEPDFHFLDSNADGELAGGFFFVPDVGTPVRFSVAVTDTVADAAPGQTFFMNPDPRWHGCILRGGQEMPADLLKNYPARMGFIDPGGNVFYFDKTKGDEAVLLKCAKGQFLQMDKDGSILLATNNKDKTDVEGMMVFMDQANKAVTILNNQNMIGVTEKGISIVHATGGFMTFTESGVQILSGKNVKVQCGVATLAAGNVLLGGDLAQEPVLKGTAFLAELVAELGLIATGISAAGGAYTPTPTIGAGSLSLVTKTL